MLAASGSSIAPNFAISIMLTRTPSRAWACAISIPIGPAPRITKWLGLTAIENKVSFVRYGTSFKPGTGGTAACAPVAITMRRAVIA